MRLKTLATVLNPNAVGTRAGLRRAGLAVCVLALPTFLLLRVPLSLLFTRGTISPLVYQAGSLAELVPLVCFCAGSYRLLWGAVSPAVGARFLQAAVAVTGGLVFLMLAEVVTSSLAMLFLLPLLS